MWGGLVWGKGISFPVGPQGALISVTPSLPDTHRGRGSRLVYMLWPSHYIYWPFCFRPFCLAFVDSLEMGE